MWEKYRSHKIVRAAPIVAVTVGEEGLDDIIISVGGDEARFEPSEPAMAKRASIGDYAVIYEDGYKSISPKKAFEEGYTRLS